MNVLLIVLFFYHPLFLLSFSIPLCYVMLFQITVTEAVLFLMQYTSKDLDSRKKTIATGDCCYLNPLVRRTCRFLGTCLIIILASSFSLNIARCFKPIYYYVPSWSFNSRKHRIHFIILDICIYY